MGKLATLLITATSGALSLGFSLATIATARIPSAGSGGEGVPFGLPQVLVVAGAGALVLLLAGLMVWRTRRAPPK